MRGAIRAGFIGTMLLLAACGQERGELYYTPLATAREELLSANVPLVIFGERPDLTIDRAQAGEKVVWQVRERMKPILQYIAEFERVEDDQTLVKLTLVGLTPDMTRQLEAKGAFADLYRTAMEEKIAATLDHRIYIGANIKGTTAVPGLTEKLATVQSQLDEGGRCPPVDQATCEQEGGLRTANGTRLTP